MAEVRETEVREPLMELMEEVGLADILESAFVFILGIGADGECLRSDFLGPDD